MAAFGELLAELRRDKKMTQAELGEILHVSTGTVSNYEKGVHLPDLEKLTALADFFSVTTDYLLGRCQSGLSPQVFDQELSGGRTVGDTIRAMQRLPGDRRQALLLVLDDMEFHAAIKERL